MRIGYMRVSKDDGTQTLDLQKDALLVAGIETQHIYEDLASGRKDDRPGLLACLKALREGDTLVVWKLDRWQTLYRFVSPNGQLRRDALKVLGQS